MDIIDFDTLVDSYYDNLVTTLRNFRPGPEFLDTWVHDEDLNRSLFGIFEAAESEGIECLEVKAGSKTANLLNRTTLRAELSRFGDPLLEENNDELTVRLSFKKNLRHSSVHPAYEAALVKAAKTIRCEGKLNEVSGDSSLYSAREKEVTLAVRLTENGMVCEAKHSGAVGNTRSLMDQFCLLLERRPLQEGAEHGVIRLENELRARDIKPPVLGLLHPDNADPMFELPKLLIRTIYAEAVKHNASLAGLNRWEDAPKSFWSGLTKEARMTVLQKALQTAAKRLNFSYEKLVVLNIKNDTRVILSGFDCLRIPDFGHHLLLLERELKREIEPRLELILESLEDRNKREARTSRDTMSLGNEPKQ